MSKRTLIKNDDGEVIKIRETSDDGSYSKDYDAMNFLGSPIKAGGPTEFHDHKENGTTQSYDIGAFGIKTKK